MAEKSKGHQSRTFNQSKGGLLVMVSGQGKHHGDRRDEKSKMEEESSIVGMPAPKKMTSA